MPTLQGTMAAEYRSYARLVQLLALALCCLLPVLAEAAATLEVRDGEVEQQLPSQWLQFHDPGLLPADTAVIFTLHDSHWRNILQLPFSLAFQRDHTLWFRFSVRNRDAEPARLVLVNTNPLTNDMAIYMASAVGIQRHDRIGNNGDGSRSALLVLPPHSEQTVYVMSQGFHAAYVTLGIESEKRFQQQQYGKHLINGMLYGMLAGLTLYNLLVGIKTRQRMYFVYGLLGAANILSMITAQGVLERWLVPDFLSLDMSNKLKVLPPLLISVFLTCFMQVFFETARQRPQAHRWLQVHIAIVLSVAAAFLAGAPLYLTTPAYMLSVIVTTCVLFQLCFTDVQNRRSSVMLMAIGLALPITTGFFTSLAVSGHFHMEGDFMYVINGTHVLEMMAFSLAMASRIRQLEDEHKRQLEAATEASIISNAHNRLLAHLNHELRTPLNGILGAAEILLHKSPLAGRHIFNMIHQTALPLKHLVDDMLNITAIAENRKAIQTVRFDLQGLLQECMDIFLPAAYSKNIRLFFRIDRPIATDVTGDPNRLRQILLNLIGNACKFTVNGEVGVHVCRMSPLPNGHCLYHFEVSDSGQGISHADEQRLFKSFEANPTSTGQSTGLGLSIVRELSELLGGSCGYGKGPSSGSTFWFSAALLPHQDVQRKPHQAFAGLRILVADENRMLCEQTARHIGSNARRFVTATSRVLLLEELEHRQYDLLVVHQPMLDQTLQERLLQAGWPTLVYIDQSEALLGEQPHGRPLFETIVRKTSTDSFALQIADFITRKSNILLQQKSASTSHSNLRVLVAEDIVTNQYIIEAMLESLSVTSVICSNGKEAFRKYLEQLEAGSPFDAVIMDCEMPIQDGFETTRQIRQHELQHGLSHLPVIALTAHTEASYRQRSLQAGMDSYLTKPVSLEAMRQSLAAVTRRPA